MGAITRIGKPASLPRVYINPEGFGGKCGCCEFRHVCGDSHAQAYAFTGDYLGAEPDCIYQQGE